MIIKGKKIYLKDGFSDKEYSKLLEWYQNIEIMKYISFVKRALPLKTIKEIKSFFKELKCAAYFGIYPRNSKKLIGYSVLVDPTNKECELGLVIGDKNYWGKGIGYEATKLTVDYAFGKLGLEKIYLKVSEHHKAAIRLYKKVGFKITKKIPKDRDVFHNNKWIKSATVCMKKTKDDYKR